MHIDVSRAGAALLAAASILLLHPPLAVAGVPSHIRYYEVASPRTPRSAPGSDGALRISLNALSRQFDLVLEPSPVLAADSRTITIDASGSHIEPTQNTLFRGHLADDIEADVRVSTSGGSVDGYVRSGSETFFVEPLSRYEQDAGSGQVIVYRASDVDDSLLPPLDCGAEHTVAAPSSSSSKRTARSHGGTVGRLELTVVADYAFTQMHPGNAGAYIQSIINQVDGFYIEDLGVTLTVVDTILYTSPGLEPFTATTDPGGLLDQVAAARNNNTDGAGAGGLTHLFTGRDLNMNVIGIAYIAALCEDFYGVGLSQNFSLDNHLMTLLVGHEMGHNFGANHDGQSGSPCSATPYGFVMWPSLSMDLDEEFSTCSQASIDPEVDAALCIVPAIPAGCGNGLPGLGEECDDGNNENGDCCRLDCKLDVSGSPCAEDGNQCTADTCNGLGLCVHPFNSAPCDDGDVCTFDGMCSFGTCQTLPDNERPLSDYRMKVSFGPEDDDDKVSLKSVMVVNTMTSPPTIGGVSLVLRDDTDAVLYDAYIPPDQWTDLTGNGTNFRYRDDGSAPPSVAGLTQMQIKYRPTTGVAKIKGKGAAQDLAILAGQPSVTARLQIGDNLQGTCAQAFELDCTAKATQLTCP